MSIEVWETDVDCWVWAIFENGRVVAVCEVAYSSRQEALEAARAYIQGLGYLSQALADEQSPCRPTRMS